MACLHADAIVIDGVNPSAPSAALLVRMRDAGVTAVNVTLAIHENQSETMRALVAWEALLDDQASVARRVRTVEDVRAAKREGRVGIIYGFQNGTPFEDELGFVSIFQRLGVRIVQPAYMTRNLIGAGCLEPEDPGLSAFGRALVRELNAHRVAIDLSHCGPRTTAEVIELSDQPVLMTHANPRALVDNPRNKDDDQLRAVAATGGVVGAVAFPSFLAPPARQATLDDLLDHIDYLVRLLGADHVGIATDFTEGREPGFLDRAFGPAAPPGVTPATWPWLGPTGFGTVDDFPNLGAALAERGHDEPTVRKILGENFLRALAEIWE
jgi:membrane dipeptidase